MKILTVVGARPQFIKAAPLSAELRKHHVEILVHTGQHYDANMSDVFFNELGMPKPDYNLGIGGGTHGEQTGRMLEEIEKVLLKETPDVVIVYGDTNSTLAASLAAVKLHIPIAHIEAGLRGFDKNIPEEVNRIVADHMAHWNFCPSQLSVNQLACENITKGVYDVGDIMMDSIRIFSEKARHKSGIIENLGLSSGQYILATVHRPSNTDDYQTLRTIFSGFSKLSMKVYVPLHPRTRHALVSHGLWDWVEKCENIVISPPVGYLDNLQLQQNSALVMTDSGGLQKEAYYLGKPCFVLFNHTPWEELVQTGWVCEWDMTEEQLIEKAEKYIHRLQWPEHPCLYGDGHSSERIVSILTK